MIVVDASVAFKWFKSKNEPFHKEAVLILSDHLSGRNKILVPHILLIEIANSLVTKTDTTDKTIKEDLEYLHKVNLEIIIPEANDILESANLARRNKTTVYDMLYAVLAKKLKTTLITADERFVRITKFAHVKLLSEV